MSMLHETRDGANLQTRLTWQTHNAIERLPNMKRQRTNTKTIVLFHFYLTTYRSDTSTPHTQGTPSPTVPTTVAAPPSGHSRPVGGGRQRVAVGGGGGGGGRDRCGREGGWCAGGNCGSRTLLQGRGQLRSKPRAEQLDRKKEAEAGQVDRSDDTVSWISTVWAGVERKRMFLTRH